MEYVLVPVPEEIVPEVKQYLRWNISGPSLGQLDQEGAVRFVESLGEQERRFLTVVAESAVESTVLSVGDAAAASRCSELEALGMMLRLNTAVQYYGTLPLGLVSRDEVETPAGWQGEPPYTFNMRADVAHLVLNAAGRGPVEH